MISKLDSWLPLDHRETLRKIAREINQALAGFIRGQSIVCLFLAVWYSVGLTLIGLDYGFLIGVVGGVLSFVPYVGSLTALVLSLSVALFQGWPSPKLFLLALAVVGTGQFLEGNVLSPQLVGELIGLHPVWLMFALLAFGQLFGFLGLLIAVPTAAAIGVVARHLIAVYLTQSVLPRPLGTGEPMMAPPRQLTFRWPHSPSFAREDFLSAPSNLDALAAIELWPNWASRMLMLVGPEGAGKSHLGAIWARAADAITLSGEALDERSIRGLRSSRRRADRRRRLRKARRGAFLSPDKHRAAKQRVAAADRPHRSGRLGPQHSRPSVATSTGARRCASPRRTSN